MMPTMRRIGVIGHSVDPAVATKTAISAQAILANVDRRRCVVFAEISDMAAYLFTENAATCPQSVMLEDGTWTDAPWMQWSGTDQFWRCFMCSNKGTRVTADHLTAPRHHDRTEGQWNQLATFTRGGQQIVRVYTDVNYEQPVMQNQLALQQAPPGLPAAPAPAAAQPAPAAAPPAALQGIADTMEQHTRAITDAMEQIMATRAEDIERIEKKFDEVMERMQVMTDRLQLVSDRIAETNQLLGTAQPRGAVQAVRALHQ